MCFFLCSRFVWHHGFIYSSVYYMPRGSYTTIYYTATHLEDVLARHVFALVSAAGNELSAMDEKENEANRVVLLTAFL
jgi:hypothetical protein